MTCRLVLITEIIAPYRIPVFNTLAKTPNIDLHVIFLADTDPSQRQWKVYRDEIHFSYEVLPNWRRRLGRKTYLLLNRGMVSALRHRSPDVIICGGYNYLASWQALWWARLHRVPIMLWCESVSHELRSESGVVDRAKRLFIRKCAGFVVPGSASREYVSSFGVPEESIVTAPDAIDNDLFSRGAAAAFHHRARISQELKLPPRYLLYVGRLIEEKGIFHLLEAYEKITPQIREQVGLVLVGEGPDRIRCLERAASIQPGCIFCSGFVHREQLPAYYSLAEALVLPTLSDPWGLVVNEAMACGLPVVVTHVAGCATDLVKNMWNGYVVAPADVAQLSAVLQSLCQNPGLSRTMGARSRERITDFSPERCAQGLALAAFRFEGKSRA